jgi:hypothetical protein
VTTYDSYPFRTGGLIVSVGPAGQNFFAGIGVPNNGMGNNGDHYAQIDASYEVWAKSSGGIWQDTGTHLMGNQGFVGAVGPAGGGASFPSSPAFALTANGATGFVASPAAWSDFTGSFTFPQQPNSDTAPTYSSNAVIFGGPASGASTTGAFVATTLPSGALGTTFDIGFVFNGITWNPSGGATPCIFGGNSDSWRLMWTSSSNTFEFVDQANGAFLPTWTASSYTAGTYGPFTLRVTDGTPSTVDLLFNNSSVSSSGPYTTSTNHMSGDGYFTIHSADINGGDSGGTIAMKAIAAFKRNLSSSDAALLQSWLAAPSVPSPYWGSLAGNIALQSGVNIYGGLLRDTSSSGNDQSTAIQTELTANHHLDMPERSQRTAQHLLLPDDGYINGNHAKINGSSAYVALEEDWIVGIECTAIGNAVQTLADPLIENLQVGGYSVPNILDGTNYGNGPPTQTMAGIWFGDLQHKPTGFTYTVAHGRVIGGGADFCTYGIRLSGFQYSRCEDVRVGGCDVGMLLESVNGEGNVDYEVDTPIMYSCLLGCMVVANDSMDGGNGALQAVTIRGGKHNGEGVTSVCHWAAISPWWRINVPFDIVSSKQGGPITFEQNGTEFLLNDFGYQWSVGREFYTKELNPTAGSSSYPLGLTPTYNKNGQAFLRQNSNGTYWMCHYVPPCSHYSEGATVVIRDPKFADNTGGRSGVFRAGPYGIVNIWNVCGAGTADARITVADDPTSQFYLYGSGIARGYYQNLYRWPDQMLLPSDPFSFVTAGGVSAEQEVYRVATSSAASPSYQKSSLSLSWQDNASEVNASTSPAFPSLLQSSGISGTSTTFSIVTATEGIFNGRKVTQMVYPGTVNASSATCSAIAAANNQPITPTLSANAPANGQLGVIDSEVFYVISGGGTTTPTLARGIQNTTPVAHAANAVFSPVSAYLTSSAASQQVTTKWLGGYASANDPGSAVDSSCFIFIHNTSGTGFWINFDAFWSGNSKYSNGDPTPVEYAWGGRTWVAAHSHARLSFCKGAYQSDYKICWYFDALQPAVTCYVSGLSFLQTPQIGLGDHTEMMQRGLWVRNLLT